MKHIIRLSQNLFNRTVLKRSKPVLRPQQLELPLTDLF